MTCSYSNLSSFDLNFKVIPLDPTNMSCLFFSSTRNTFYENIMIGFKNRNHVSQTSSKSKNRTKTRLKLNISTIKRIHKNVKPSCYLSNTDMMILSNNFFLFVISLTSEEVEIYPEGDISLTISHWCVKTLYHS